MGTNKRISNQHLSKYKICHYFDKQKRVATGLLPDISLSVDIKNCNPSEHPSYAFKQYIINRVTDKVHLDIIDDTLEKDV